MIEHMFESRWMTCADLAAFGEDLRTLGTGAAGAAELIARSGALKSSRAPPQRPRRD
jgi:hypothetical protein